MAPSLVLLAAGVGHRYGGPKQLDPVGPGGATLIDYAAFDARRVGFEHVVLIVRSEIEEAVRDVVAGGAGRRLRVDYAVQEAALPRGFRSPAGRAKPWGTGAALVAAAPFLKGPFAVVNADDFYGAGTYRILANWLDRSPPASEHALVAFALRKTLSPAGPVNRGVCRVDAAGFLREVREVLEIEAKGDGAWHPGPDGTRAPLDGETPVSLNFWGFSPKVLPSFEEALDHFLAEHGSSTTAELFLPRVVQGLVEHGDTRVRVLRGGGPWAGLTYPRDRPHLVAFLAEQTARGEYPRDLWD
jgi:hypothetical protein